MTTSTEPGVLTPEEKAEFERKLADLHAHGYVDIQEHRALRVGSRVRHSGHQWFEAVVEGTGFILAITEKPNSSWSRSWGGPDVELIVLFDQTRGSDSRVSDIASYHTFLAGPQPSDEKPVA